MGNIQQHRAESGPLSAAGTTTAFPPTGAAGWGSSATSGSARSVVIRLFAAVWFLLLSAASVRTISGQIADIAAGQTNFGAAWPALLSQGCIFTFYTIIFCIMILRPEPVSRAEASDRRVDAGRFVWPMADLPAAAWARIAGARDCVGGDPLH